MNIHEYQARELFEAFGVATSKGKVASTPQEAEAVAEALGGGMKIVVKAQIHAGGRGKGTFTNGFKGGVQMCANPGEAREFASKMLGQTLVTHQTGPEGRQVNQVLVAEAVDISRELYFAILLDRVTSAPVVIVSTEGGMDIEEVAASHPEKIMREPVHPLLGLQPYQTRKLAGLLGLKGPLLAAGLANSSRTCTGSSSSATARRSRSTRSSSLPTDACSRSTRSLTSTTTRSIGSPASWPCATRPRKTRAKSPPASTA